MPWSYSRQILFVAILDSGEFFLNKALFGKQKYVQYSF